jgi:hypothetical protein
VILIGACLLEWRDKIAASFTCCQETVIVYYTSLKHYYGIFTMPKLQMNFGKIHLMAQAKKAIREYAELLYVEKGWKQSAIAETLDVAPKTIVDWKQKDDWDAKKAAFFGAPHKIKAVILQELLKVSEGQESIINADALSKIYKVYADMNDQISVEICMSVLQELDNFLVNDNPKLAVECSPYHRKFLLHKINNQ